MVTEAEVRLGPSTLTSDRLEAQGREVCSQDTSAGGRDSHERITICQRQQAVFGVSAAGC